MQTKDIPDEPVLEFLRTLARRGYPSWATIFEGYPNSVQNAMPPGIPYKLALSKMKSLIRRGLVEGCTCGCRGDFELATITLKEAGK